MQKFQLVVAVGVVALGLFSSPALAHRGGPGGSGAGGERRPPDPNRGNGSTDGKGGAENNRDHDRPPTGPAEHRDRSRAMILVTIRVLEARVAELERTMNFDNREAKELEAHASVRDRSADV